MPKAAPVLIPPVSRWNRSSEEALQFACSLFQDVQALHVQCAEENGEENSENWQQQIDEEAKRDGMKTPTLVSVVSPYRFITIPILNYVLQAEQRFPDRTISLVVPDLVATHWYQYLFHNHRSTALKTLLLFKGKWRIVLATYRATGTIR